MKRRLLLHICCGVCASRIIERLQPEFEVVGYFYNPNIEPPVEYQLRLKATEVITNHYGMRLIKGQYANKIWHHAVTGMEYWDEGGRRCWRCFGLRLEDTAEYAKKESINYFATTLTASPYKDAKAINALGKKIGLQHNVNFIGLSYRPEDKNKPSLARKLGLYHQKYCGCIYSAGI